VYTRVSAEDLVPVRRWYHRPMLRAYVVVWCALGACIEAELVPCENGVACPTGTVCDEPHKTCVTPEQATVCRFKLERDPCLENGACHHGICVPIECGNWLRDPLEMCDDGNTQSGDGCSADCSTNETCGNGVIDPARGEVCDDGALASHDGCDSQCQMESPRFTPLVQTIGLSRELSAYAFDDARGTLVIFGGLDENDERTGETLELDGTTKTFRVRSPTIAPTPRYGAAMAYDAKRSNLVMFGGSDPSGPVADTWTWDGDQWRVMQPATSPSPRLYASITYDSRRKRVLLFGGRGASGVLADLWAWNGATWTELTPAAMPPPRERAMFAYDPLHDRVVLLGGIANGTSQPDMWLFDGDTWQTLTPPGIPSARFGGTMTFDPERGGLVMTGGSTTSPTQLWDGNQWSVIGVSNTVMTARVHHVAFYDPQIKTIVAGLGAIADVPQPDLHQLDGDAWSELAQTDGPRHMNDVAMTFDMRRGEVVMFGGSFGGSPSFQTWLHDGTTWILKAPLESPSARFAAAIAYDERRGKTVMWGGSTVDEDVHEWDGFGWSKVTVTGPMPRARAKMAYDPISGTTVLFGGENGGTRFGDTWQWDGATWSQMTTSPAPSARSQHAMAYDRARGEVVLFGGIEEGTNLRLGDTWTWTASGGWVQEQPLASPSPRIQAVMANDPYRDELVLFGGAVGTGPLGDVWTWDGTTWSRQFPDDPPPLFGNAGATYDNARRHVIISGSQGTWRLQWRGAAADEACRSVIDRDGDKLRGCNDPDCSAYCTPLCPDAPPGSPCAGPICGDQMCSPMESCRLCDRDCGFCTARCGDTYCDGGETCPGECP
jgi:cysteine-rich repeat protein